MMKKRGSGSYIILLLCLVLVVSSAVISGGCSAGKSPAPGSTSEAAVTSPPVEASPSAATTAAPVQTPASTPAASGTPTAAPDVPQCPPAADDYFSDAVFVGNSLVDGLYLYGGVSNCHWLSGTGVSLYNIDKQKISDKLGGECTVMDGLSRQKYGKVYIELGINEISMSAKDFVKSYGDFIDKIRAVQPDAKIYVLSLTPVSAKKSADGGYFTKENVLAYNAALHKLSSEKGCLYIDSCTSLADKDGYLPGSATSDGIHFNPSYYSAWMDVIRTHYV